MTRSGQPTQRSAHTHVLSMVFVGLLSCSSALAADVSLVSSVLPASRSVQVGDTATAFAAIINSGSETGTDCAISPATQVAADFFFQTTDPATNSPEGTRDDPIDIPAGGTQTFVFGFVPNAPFDATDVELTFECSNSSSAPVTTGLNTLLLSASADPVPDIVALAATAQGTGIAQIEGDDGTGVFAVATVNVGAGGTIDVTADTGGVTLPIGTVLCETDPATGACISVLAAVITTTIAADATPTFTVLVPGSGNVPFDPAVNRVFTRFNDDAGITRGATSVSVQTIYPPVAYAGVDRPAVEGTTISVGGAGTATTGTIVSYHWVQLAGPTVTIINDSSAWLSFRAPIVDSPDDLRFRLTVTDSDGLTGSDDVTITVYKRKALSTVDFPDAAMAACISALNLIYIDQVRDLDCSERGVLDAGGVEELLWLETLDLADNSLPTVDVTRMPMLEELYLAGNAIVSIDVSNNPELTILDLAFNQLASLDVSANTKLTEMCRPTRSSRCSFSRTTT